MRRAEAVTFGGSGLDRAAHLRGDAALAHDPAARVVPLWRGKPLMAAGRAHWLPRAHPALEGAGCMAFLGLDADGPRFCADLSGWTPADAPEGLDSFSDRSEQAHPACPGAAFTELRAAMTLLPPRDAELLATARALLSWHRTHGFCAACGAPTGIAQGGWQRECPACGARHFPRTDPVVIMLVTHGDRVLLGRAAAWPEGMFSLLAGFVEPGETIEAAVRRETFEEAGVRVGAVGYLASQPWPFPASLMIGCHGAALDDRITVDPAEIEAARWVSREDAAEALAGRHPEISPARPGAIARFLIERWLQDRLD